MFVNHTCSDWNLTICCVYLGFLRFWKFSFRFKIFENSVNSKEQRSRNSENGKKIKEKRENYFFHMSTFHTKCNKVPNNRTKRSEYFKWKFSVASFMSWMCHFSLSNQLHSVEWKELGWDDAAVINENFVLWLSINRGL